MAVKVSQSRVKLWQRCKQAHYFKYIEKLERKVKSRPLQFGIIVHQMLESHANNEDPFETLNQIEQDQGKMFRAQREELGEIIEAVRLIMTAYFEYYENNPLKYLKLNGKKAEHELEVEIEDGIILLMVLDGIVKTPNKLRWLLENKTFKSLPGDDDRWRNYQTAVYFRGCELLGMKPFDGICWNYIRSKEPRVPQINKDGSMSVRKIETFPAVIRRVAEEHGITHYKAQLNHAKKTAPLWFERIFTVLSPAIVDMTFDNFLESAREIAEFGKEKCHKEIDRHCAWCDYEPICRTELTGGDSDFVKEKEYGKRKKKKSTRTSRGRSR